jgi:hypothetical protein
MQQFWLVAVIGMGICPQAVAGQAAPNRDCPALAHMPTADVAFKADPKRPADLDQPFAVEPRNLDIPVVIDVLRKKYAPTGQPLEGKTAVARITSGKDGWQMTSVTNPEAAPVALERPCLPHIDRPTILKPRPRPARAER